MAGEVIHHDYPVKRMMIDDSKPCPQSIVDDTGKEKLDKRVVIAGRRENGLMTLLPG